MHADPIAFAVGEHGDMADVLDYPSLLHQHASPRVGCPLRRGFHPPPLMFDAEEVAALELGGRMVQGWADSDLAKAAAKALLKIESVVPAGQGEALNRGTMLVPDFHVSPAMVAPLGLLRQAIDACVKVAQDDRRAEGDSSHRVVCPLGLIFRGGAWTLGGWCPLRDDFRTFRLDRISGPQRLAERFEPLTGRALTDYLNLAGNT